MSLGEKMELYKNKNKTKTYEPEILHSANILQKMKGKKGIFTQQKLKGFITRKLTLKKC